MIGVQNLKIYDEVIEFIENILKDWSLKLEVVGKRFDDVKIHKEIFHGDVLSSLLFVIAMMPLNHMLGNTQVDKKKTS